MTSSRMIAPVSNNIEKQETYREQIKMFNKAVHEGFFLQAILIDYALLEDRFRSFLYHTGAFNDRLSKSINAKIAKEPLKEMVKLFKRKEENDSLCITNISGKMKIIRSTIEWSIQANNIQPNDKYRYVLKNCLESLDQEEMLCIIEEVSGWCKYRNEIIHSLLNKNSYAVNEIVQVKAEEGFRLARRLDDQVHILRKKCIRKRLNLQTDRIRR